MVWRTFGWWMVCVATAGACKSGADASGSDTGSDSDSASGSDTTGSSPTTGTASSATSTDTAAPTTGGTTQSTDPTAGEFPCSPKASCEAAQPGCIGLVDNTGASTYALRMSQLVFSGPAALSGGPVANTLAGAVGLNLPACNLTGGGSWSWLLQFDSGAGTLRTGGAQPVADPFAGYSFDVNNSPAVMDAAVGGDGSFAAAKGVDLVMPINLGPGAELLLPMRGLIMGGTVSADQGCIGTYNAEGLDPGNSCLPDDQTPAFVNGGKLSAHVLLAEADEIDITLLKQSLCVLLSGDPTTYGDGAMPISRCKRDAGMAIVYKGDWCDATNMAADANCFDSVQLTADFAASSVKLN